MNHTEGQGNLQSILDTDTGGHPKIACRRMTAGEQKITRATG